MRAVWWVGLALPVLGGAALMGVRGESAVAVNTEPAAVGDVAATVTGAGEIAARLEVSVSARASGQVTAIAVREHDRVEKGQLLATVDSRLLEATVQEASAALAAARAERERLQAELERSQAQYRRFSALHAQGVVSDDALEDARFQVAARRAALSAQEQRVQQQEAWVSRGREDVRHAEVRAPIDGVVTRIEKKVGENVIGAQSFSPTPILVLSDLSAMDAAVRIHERDIERVGVGQTATVTVDALGGARLRGRVRDIGSSGRADPSTGARTREFLVRIALEDQEGRLRPGLSALAEVVVASRSGVVRVVPEALVLSGAGGASSGSATDVRAGGEPSKAQAVFLVRDGRAVLRHVEAGLIGDDHVEVQGIAAGEEVVVGPYRTVRTLREGTKLQRAAR
jgi:HlyD family secretion protein